MKFGDRLKPGLKYLIDKINCYIQPLGELKIKLKARAIASTVINKYCHAKGMQIVTQNKNSEPSLLESESHLADFM